VDKNPLIRKGLAVGIVLLLVSVTIAPYINFNVVKASNDNDLVEVTTQACGIKGFGNTTVKLTREQYQNLEQYLVGFRARLNQTTTMDEAVSIFKEAVAELNKYGLLPKGLSVEQAQTLVLTGYINENLMNHLQEIYQRHRWISSGESNTFCLVAGATNQTVLTGIVFTTFLSAILLLARLWALSEKFGLHFLESIVCSFAVLLYFSECLLLVLCSKLGCHVPIGELTMFGKRVTKGQGPSISYPSEGWIWTKGLKGEKKWNGSFVGDIYFFNLVRIAAVEKYYIGAIGFTGFTFKRISNGETIFLGTALQIALDTEPPYP
jgi:hypothetical protein